MSKKHQTRVALKVADAAIAREVVLAQPTSDRSTYLVKSIPAFASGVAPGDLIKVLDTESGEFSVLKRSGQLAIRAYVEGTLDRPEVASLIAQVTSLGGTFEVGANRKDADQTSLLLLSVDVRQGFRSIESMMERLSAIGGHWEYGNVYDEVGAPLNWWRSGKNGPG